MCIHTCIHTCIQTLVPAITVLDCHSRCPADLDGKIKLGDKLVRVDGETVIGMALDHIYGLILGDIGTEVFTLCVFMLMYVRSCL